MPLRPHLPEGWYLVYWRAISVDGHPVQGAFTFAVGPNPGPPPQFVGAEDLRDGDHAAAGDRAVGDVPDGDGGDRSVRAADRDRTASRQARSRVEPAPGLGRVRGRVDPRADRDPRLPRHRDRDRLVALGVRDRRARAAVPRHRVRPRLRRHRDLLRAVLRRSVDRPLGRPARARAPVDRRAARGHSARCSPPPPCWSSRAPPDTRRRPRPAGSRFCSTGFTSSPARCGSAG